MWWSVICVIPVLVVICKLVKRFFYGGGDVLAIPSSSDLNSLLSIVSRYCLESDFIGEVKALAVALRIPDVDLLLQLHGEVMLISVKNDISGFVTIDKHGKWICTTKHQTIRIPDPLAQAQQQLSLLQSYLQQRGLHLPEGYISCKLMCLNPNFRPVDPASFPSQVVTREEFDKLKSETQGSLLDRLISMQCKKKNMQESLHEKLHLLLKKARQWDRLSLKDGQGILGEFLEFKGMQDDVQALQNLTRSKGHFAILPELNTLGLAADLASIYFQHMNTGAKRYLEFVKSLLFYTIRRMSTLLKSSPSNLTCMYFPQEDGDGNPCSRYNGENLVTVRSNTEILFQARQSTIVRKYKLSSVTYMTLSP